VVLAKEIEMAKVVSKSSPSFATGGGAAPFSEKHDPTAGTAKAGKTTNESFNDSAKFAKGGSGGFNPSGTNSAGPAVPGKTAVSRSGDGGKFAKGGTHSMMSNRGSVPARPGRSSAY
jgi:hypothetical protein